MSIPTAKGAVQLNQVAYLSYENEDGMIWRRNLLPTVTVNAGPVPAMLIIMVILLMLMLMDVRKVFVVTCIAPLGLVGVILGLFLFNTPMGIMAQTGALALVGTIIRNGTVLVDQIDQHLAQGMPRLKAVTESVIVRFRPIMLTALTTVLGLIPMFPSDFWRGMAIAISCGLTVATLITLVVMPVIYCMVFKVSNEEK